MSRVIGRSNRRLSLGVMQGDYWVALLHNIVLTESIEIEATPEKLFNYLISIVDDESFKRLNTDNISFRWLKGQPWTVGSIAQAEKYLQGKPHGFRFVVSKVVPHHHIEYMPASRLMRVFFPKKEFIIERQENTCLFVSSATFRIGWIGETFFKKKIDEGLLSFRAYLQEEGKNLKKLMEA
jgi:hypothetical protein